MAAVLLMDNADDGGVFGGVFIGDLAGVVFGAVIHKDDLGVFASGQQGLDAMAHISGRIVARHSKGDEFHKFLPLCLVIKGQYISYALWAKIASGTTKSARCQRLHIGTGRLLAGRFWFLRGSVRLGGTAQVYVLHPITIAVIAMNARRHHVVIHFFRQAVRRGRLQKTIHPLG